MMSALALVLRMLPGPYPQQRVQNRICATQNIRLIVVHGKPPFNRLVNNRVAAQSSEIVQLGVRTKEGDGRDQSWLSLH
jgi:hypothetical protein